MESRWRENAKKMHASIEAETEARRASEHRLFAARAHGPGQLAQHRHGLGPAEAGVGDALTVSERTARGRLLPAGHQVALEHDPRDGAIAAAQLPGQIVRHRRLPERILAAVAVAAIDHETPRQLGLLERADR